MAKTVAVLAVIALSLLSLSNAQFEGVQLGGATGIYGEDNRTRVAFCHDVSAGWYNYEFPLGFGFGNIVALSGGGWRAQGVWVECGIVGQEIITIFPNGTLSDQFWLDEPGDFSGVAGEKNPLILQKSNATATPTPEQCLWLNKNVSGTLEGHWAVPGVDTTADNCIVGNKYIRSAYNETIGPVDNVGYQSGANFLNVVFTGHFVEVKQLNGSCVQGCELMKLGGDGSVMFEKYWCTLHPETDPLGSTKYLYNKGANTTENSVNAEHPICYFAAMPEYGWTTMQLSNATLP